MVDVVVDDGVVFIRSLVERQHLVHVLQLLLGDIRGQPVRHDAARPDVAVAYVAHGLLHFVGDFCRFCRQGAFHQFELFFGCHLVESVKPDRSLGGNQGEVEPRLSEMQHMRDLFHDMSRSGFGLFKNGSRYGYHRPGNTQHAFHAA